ncbi:sterol desaturase family protein [Niabella insulamsoli]|uniref:sterol desaturase family protein n=1 Tax=Niabella insulamsoli TaxID=3144874 RepID=UPI0031FBA82F
MQGLLNILIAAGASFIFLFLVFLPMEKAFPARKGQKIIRKNWVLDLCYFLGQYLLWNGLVLLALHYLGEEVDQWIPGRFREMVSSQPLWLQSIEVILLSDLLIYWGHRLQHKIAFLWRFHKVHHSAEELDWLAAHREHPLDTIYTVGLINLPALVMGFNLEALAILVAFRGIWAIYIHSNVRLPLGPLKYLIGAPELHHWHHSIDRDAGNYANVSPLMDLIFGTYTCPAQEPEHFGIKERFPQNYLGQLLKPMLPADKKNNEEQQPST